MSFFFFIFYFLLLCPYSELFWSAFSRIRTEYGEIPSISPYSVRMREKADQNNSKYENMLRSGLSSYYFVQNAEKRYSYRERIWYCITDDTRTRSKQPSRGVLNKRCSKDMQQIYRRTPMPKWDFNKVALQHHSLTLPKCYQMTSAELLFPTNWQRWYNQPPDDVATLW